MGGIQTDTFTIKQWSERPVTKIKRQNFKKFTLDVELDYEQNLFG